MLVSVLIVVNSMFTVRNHFFSLIYISPYVVSSHVGPGSSLKPRVNTPRSENMLGSLMIVFPTVCEGGALVLRGAGKEWVIDATRDMRKNPDPCVAFAAFCNDVEHEVLPITSGYRVTMTYNVCYEKAPSIGYVRTSIDELYLTLKTLFEEVLVHPDILPKGGYLGFGLEREYGLSPTSDLRRVESNLKGSDAIILSICRELSVDGSLRVLYQDAYDGEDILSTELHDFDDPSYETPMDDVEGVRVVRRSDSGHPANLYEGARDIKWVTGDLKHGYVTQQIVIRDYKRPSLEEVFGHVCLIVALGPYGDRRNVQ